MSKNQKKKIFIGVAWPYVNGDLHIGHLAGYLLPADIFARFHSFRGNDVLMASGSDCFGTPITIEAEKLGISPKEVVNKYHSQIVKLFEKTGISFSENGIYTKTTTDNHREVVQDFFIRLLEKGYIFKDKTGQYYSEEDKRFLPDRYVEGKCPHCGYEGARSDQCDSCGIILNVGELINPKSKLSGGEIEIRKTEHYFLDWQKLQSFLEGYVKKNGKRWRPWVLGETEGWLKKGLKPRAITRDLDWGIEIPVDRIPKDLKIEGVEHKRIYVWFENIIGYLSASIEWSEKSGKDWKDWWYDAESEHVYFMGKDNLVFHTLFWPGELHIYDDKVHLPDYPVINQFLNLEGKKFSKSRGVTIDSGQIVDDYGLDAVRFYLTFIAPQNTDANFSWEEFVNVNNGILIASLGNFINRTLTLAKDSDFSKVKLDSELLEKVRKTVKDAVGYLEKAEFREYVHKSILYLSGEGNSYLGLKEPWLDKNKQDFIDVVGNALFIVFALFLITKPLLPELNEKLEKILNVKFDRWPEDEIEELKNLFSKVKIGKVKPLFKKIDESRVDIERKKINPA